MLNVEVEQWLIGGLFQAPNVILDLTCKPEEFSEPLHGAIFRKMQALMGAKGTFCLSDFSDWDLHEDIKKSFAPNGLSEYLKALIESTHEGAFFADNDGLKNYANRVTEYNRKAKVLDLYDTIRARIHELSYHEICTMLSTLSLQEDTQGLRSGREVYDSILKNMALPARKYSTGIRVLDEVMGGGFFESFTYGFCGAEKSGKTTLAHTLSYNLALNGTKHLYVALEMGSEQIEQRNLARDLQTNSIKFLNAVSSLIPQMKTVLPRQNIWYYDAPGATLNEILNRVTQAKAKHQISGFIVDYWQLIQGQDSRQTEEKHLRDVAQGLANFARKNKLWCMLLAQRNQDGKLFGGNGLRKACDQLFMIETPEGYDDYRWLKMDASRYTMRVDCGSEKSPSMILNKRIGPHFEPVMDTIAQPVQPRNYAEN